MDSCDDFAWENILVFSRSGEKYALHLMEGLETLRAHSLRIAKVDGILSIL